ncbi:MAG: protein phosphatase 2C family protein [Dolichospermum sp. DEX189]|jgi:hypothetical protein|uniref:PPM-type phosphatase domain-containing protein n=1 Tax=Dolichospermum heterosporum TAC447 TaxID=747523 RepID=A0ABY5M0D6_9CYAN|nr:protein phosphatase 2C domain-containing protein [Dolichospermum heterosporum]MBO1070766.1 protein phosphatase 2C family protein [Dolichospermum sp. DEX189]UUO17733.1 hypothetical protein NG743_12515 [Dolichospermum heterosporum TAC447]
MSISLIFHGRTQKEKENLSDCQDYLETNTEKNCFAIADGASQSFYPSIWAELLVKHFCQTPEINQDNWQDWLQPIQEKWFAEVEERVIKARAENSPVWVTNQNRFNFRESAASTFIGLQFIGDLVEVSIIGDSCLFVVEDDKLIQAYLLDNSTKFNNLPEYFASRSKDNNFSPQCFNLHLIQKKSTNNLYFILATDSLSEYIFKCVEQKNNIFRTLIGISSDSEFEKFVISARNSENIKMKNDDVTLLILSIPNRSIDHQSSLQSTDKVEGNTKDVLSSSNEQSGDKNKSSSKSTDAVEGNTKDFLSSSNEQSSEATESSLNFIFHIFRQLMSAVKFRNLTQKNIPKVSLNRDKLVPTIEELQKQNTRLRYQRFGLGLGLGICLFIISLLLGMLFNKKQESITESEQLPNTNLNQTKKNATPVSTEKSKLSLKKEISIYNNQTLTNVFANLLLDLSEVEIIGEGDKWTKFKKELYIYRTLVTDNCNDCKGDEIETITTNQPINLRLSPDPKGIIFASLKDKSRFNKLEFESKNWYKFEFVGYIKNEVSTQK